MTERENTKEFKVVIFWWYDEGQFFPSFFPLIYSFGNTVST